MVSLAKQDHVVVEVRKIKELGGLTRGSEWTMVDGNAIQNASTSHGHCLYAPAGRVRNSSLSKRNSEMPRTLRLHTLDHRIPLRIGMNIGTTAGKMIKPWNGWFVDEQGYQLALLPLIMNVGVAQKCI